MKSKNLLTTLVFTLLAVILSGCAGAAATTSGFGGVTHDGQTAFLAINQNVYAVDLASGLEVWRFPPEGERADANRTFFSPPVLTEDGQLLASSYNNNLYSLNPSTGAVNWIFNGGIPGASNGRFIASPLATSEGIYAPNANGVLYALDLNGELLWTFESNGEQWSTPATDEACDCIYLSAMDHFVYAINAEDGSLLWEKDMGSAMVGQPAVSDGVLYIGNFASQMAALDTSDGRIIWQQDLSGWVWAGPALFEDRLFFGDVDGNFYSLQASDGEILWQIKPDGPITSTPAVTESDVIFTTESGTVYSVNHDLQNNWMQTVEGALYAAPVRTGESILVTPVQSDTLLVILNANGSIKTSFPPPGAN